MNWEKILEYSDWRLELFTKLSPWGFADMADISSVDLSLVKRDLIKANWDCSVRGLIHGATR